MKESEPLKNQEAKTVFSCLPGGELEITENFFPGILSIAERNILLCGLVDVAVFIHSLWLAKHYI